MLKTHGWYDPSTLQMDTANDIIPVSGDKEYLCKLDKAIPPDHQGTQQELQAEFGFKYRQVVGEILYPMVKCQPDLSNTIIKLISSCR